MIKKGIIFSFLLIFSVLIHAQDVISTQGDSYSNASGSIGFTIGEPLIETYPSTSNDLTQGFHQTNLLISRVEETDMNFSVKVFPNPTCKVLKISTEDYHGMEALLLNTEGKVVLSLTLDGELSTINMEGISDGIYLLKILTLEKVITSYKIIKQ